MTLQEHCDAAYRARVAETQRLIKKYNCKTYEELRLARLNEMKEVEENDSDNV